MNSPLEVYCPQLSARDEAGVIAELAAALASTGSVDDVAAFTAAVHAREEQQRTWLGREAALPHARITGVRNLTLVIGRLAEGVPWGAVDQPVRLVFLVAVPPNAGVDYLFLTQRITRTLRDNAKRRALLNATTAEALAAAWRTDA